MAEPFIGEIRIWGGTFAPKDWANCAGQIIPVSQNQTLYALLGTYYGGDGRSTFGLPDLRGRAAVGKGDAYQIGGRGGFETVPLDVTTNAAHTHTFYASSSSENLKGNVGKNDNRRMPGTPAAGDNLYSTTASERKQLDPKSFLATGAGVAHYNMQPSLVMNFCIALNGLFPSRN